MSEPRDALQERKKTLAQKNGRSEERPEVQEVKRPGKGGGLAIEIAIPRCNNMKKLGPVCKTQSITSLQTKRRRNPGKILSQNVPDFGSSAASFSNCAVHHQPKIWLTRRDSSRISQVIGRNRQKSRVASAAISAAEEAGDTDGRCCVV
jgi:hypothetical protein